MKKYISLFIAIVLLTSLMPAGISVSAAEEPLLIFDMDLSNAAQDDLANTITDKSDYEGAATIDTVAYNNSADVPVLMTEGDITFLRFASLEGGTAVNKNANVHVTMKNTDLAFEDKLTFEMMIRGNYFNGADGYTACDRLFAFGHAGNGSATSLRKRVFEVEFENMNKTANKALAFYPDREENKLLVTAKTGSLSSYDEQWIHVVITRVWTPDSAESPFGSGEWASDIYINGEKVVSGTKTAGARFNHTDATNIRDDLIIGAGCTPNEGNNAFGGDIAAFKVYKGVFASDADVYDKYMDEGREHLDLAKTSGAEAELESITDATETFTIAFDRDMEPSSFKNDEIYIEDAQKNKVNVEFVSYENREATFKILDYLKSGATYKLCIPNVTDTLGQILKDRYVEFTASAAADDTTVDAPTSIVAGEGDAKVATVTVPVTTSTSKSLIVGVVIYDASDRVVNFRKSVPASINGDGSLTVSTAGVTLPDGYKLKTIVYGEDFVPVSSVIDVTE